MSNRMAMVCEPNERKLSWKKIGSNRHAVSLDIDELEDGMRLMKDAGRSKMEVHFVHLKELIDVYREWRDRPRFDARRMG